MKGSLATAVPASGVVLFIFGLYGVLGEVSTFVSGAGLIILVIGLGMLIVASWPAKFVRPHRYVVGATALAFLLHSYEQLAQSSGGPSVAWLAWAMMPYILCLVVSAFPRTRSPAVAGAVVSVAFDCFAYYSVFINPQGSSAALLLIFAPIWNTVVIAPIAIVIADRLVHRVVGLGGNAP